MQQDSIERIRSATFTIARKGYDTREVERFLTKLADWLESGGGDQARSDLVKRELERVGEKTAGILASAEDSAEQMRGEAEQEATATLNKAREQAAAVRQEADAYSSKTRSDADGYADKARRDADQAAQDTRSEAETDAREALAKAQAKAQRIVEEGARRRRDIEAVISDLAQRRDAVLADVDQLTGQLRSAVAGHAPPPGADPFATPDELDPAEQTTPRRRRTAGGDQVKA